MKMKMIVSNIAALAVIGATVTVPMTAVAQRDHDRYNDRYNGHSREYNHRQQTKNQWRNLAIGSGAVGLLGLLTHDNTLTFAGAGGALYSAYRYDQDRKSENRIDRARAEMFSRGEFDRNGHHYSRRTVYRDGHKYYQFRRDR